MLSPVTHVNADSPPTLTVHGEADRIVPVAQAVALDKALTEAAFFTKPTTFHGLTNY